MVAQQVAAQSASGKISAGGANLSGSMSALYGAGGDVNAMVQGAYPVDAGKQFALSANAQLSPVESAFDATAASLGLTRDQARALIAADSGASLVGSSLNGPGVDVRAVPYPQIAASPLPETDVRLAQTDGGFWRGLSGDRRSVFETPAPLSEKIGAGVRAVGEFFADPFIEVGNQYRDVFSAASGATGGWHSAFAQQVSDGSYGGAALTEFGAVAGAVPLAGAAFKGVGALAPKVDLAFESYAARTGALSYMAESGQALGSASPISGSANAVRETVLANIAESQAARTSSNFSQFSKVEGQLQEVLGIWPPNSGGYSPLLNVTLDVGMQFDRYGFPGGNYVSPLGTSFGARALPSSYEATKP